MVFPTKLRVKVSGRLSYPARAELISSAFANVPQAQGLEIRFHAKNERMETRDQPYSIFTVTYAGAQTHQPAWSIVVHPVPRSLKHTIRESLIHEFFPRIQQWLQKYAGLNKRYGFHSLSVKLDEEDKALLKLEEHHSSGEALSN